MVIRSGWATCFSPSLPDPRIERPRFCSQCGDPVVVADAHFCKNCGAPLTHTVWFNPNIAWRPRVAVALSVVPGLGHWYKGERARGLLWFFFVTLLYFFSNAQMVGFLLHLICACNAGLGGAIREEAIAKSARHRMRPRAHPGSRRGSHQMTAQPPGL